MKIFAKLVVAALGCLASSLLLAGDISGFWKNDESPAWIEIRFEGDTGTGTVRRNDEHPDRVGRMLLKDLVSDADQAGTWRGQIYAERFEEYKDAEISLPEADRMQIKVKVGFMSRTVEWTRAPDLPE